MRVAIAFMVMASVLVQAGPAAAFKETPERTWGANGPVNAVLRVRGRIFIGGDFSALVSPGGRKVARHNLAALRAKTGNPIKGWSPRVNGPVFDLESSARI